jgi:hypothetical protein
MNRLHEKVFKPQQKKYITSIGLIETYQAFFVYKKGSFSPIRIQKQLLAFTIISLSF